VTRAGHGAPDRLLLDQVAADRWPAAEQVVVDGWRLRAASGVTRRANSALPSGGLPSGGLPAALDERLDVVREFYVERGLPVLVQVSDPDLDAALDARGWGRHTPTLVMTGPVRTGPGPPLRQDTPDDRLELSPTAGPEWLDCWWAVDGRGGEQELQVARTCLSAIASPACFVRLRAFGQRGDRAGRVVAVGRGVVKSGWLGVYAMAVLPEHRSRGHGREVLAALTRWGLDAGAQAAFLQVAQDNRRAQQLYAAGGFAPAYGYSYRTPSPEEGPPHD